jgi:hypothetical protein
MKMIKKKKKRNKKKKSRLRRKRRRFPKGTLITKWNAAKKRSLSNHSNTGRSFQSIKGEKE